LCICILLVGSQPEPLHSFLLINWNSVTLVIHHSKVVLPIRIAMASSHVEPLHGFLFVDRNSFALFIHHSKAALCLCVSFFGGYSIASNFVIR
jgi:hypothetical protein